MSLDQIIDEMFDMVRSRKFSRDELIDYIKRTYETSSDRIANMVIDGCEERIKKFVDNLGLINK